MFDFVSQFYITFVRDYKAAIVVGCKEEDCSIQCFVCLADIQRRFDRHYVTRPVVVHLWSQQGLGQ